MNMLTLATVLSYTLLIITGVGVYVVFNNPSPEGTFGLAGLCLITLAALVWRDLRFAQWLLEDLERVI